MPCLQCIDGWNIEQQIDTSRLWPFQSILGPTELLIVDGFISFRGKRRRRPFFSFSTYKKNLACRTLPVEMVWARNWVGEFFFHETQVRWRPSEALRPVHDVVWKLNRLATKTEKHFWSILLVLVIDMEHLIYMYIYIYVYWSSFCWQNLSWEYFLLLQLTHCVLTYHLKRGCLFTQPRANLKHVA